MQEEVTRKTIALAIKTAKLDGKVLAEAQRLSAAFQSLQAPNSPNGTHFVAEVSPWFERIASSKEHERLFALLPYKTLYLSSVKDRHGVFAFISKHDLCRTIAAISDALPDMNADMRPLAEQTIHKLHNITDAAFEEAQLPMTLSDAE